MRIPLPSGTGKRTNKVDGRGRFPANLLVSDKVLHTDEPFSDYFSLDAWWEKKLSELPESVRDCFPFLIVPKASQAERRQGIKEAPSETGRNIHPTVKPLRLMWFLVTLGSRAGDVVLDPFVGSGTTCIIAQLLDRHYVGVEREPEYVRIARGRLEAHKKTKTRSQFRRVVGEK